MAARDRRSTDLLGDLRVVDLTDAYGALAGRVLADLGAEVVRIEEPGGGRGRRRAPRGPDGTSLHHAHRNAGKIVLTLDPDDDDGRATLDGLLAGAELCLVADGWGAGRPDLGAAALSFRNPHLTVVSVLPFGLEGPAASWRSTELVAQSLAGVVYRSGVPERAPVAAPGSYCEDVGAVTAALAGLIALHQAGDGAGGQLVDLSSVLALAQCTDMSLPLWSLLRADQVRTGAGLYPLFPCTDGLARIVLPMTPADWRSLIEWLGAPPEWTGPEWEKPTLGEEERAQVMARLPSRFEGRTREEVTVDGEAAGIRVTPVLTPAEVLANEHTVSRGTFCDLAVGGATAWAPAGVASVGGERASTRGRVRDGAPPRWRDRRTPSAPPRPASLPLEGLRVLEIGTGVAAPEAGRVLGEWGAEVVKVESRRRPDFQRMVLGSEMNPAFATVARTKLGLGADLSRPEGVELVRRLLPSIDVVVENNATGVLDRLGLGWEVLHAANPSLVLVDTQLYGDRGPWATRKGYGPSARAVGGLTWLWAHDPDAPRGIQTIHPDHLAGRLVALAALAGVRARERSGEGCRVDIAQFEAVAFLLGDLLMAESLEPGAAVPTGNVDAEHAPWGLYRCADDEGVESWLAVCVTDDDAWEALVSASDGGLEARSGWATEAGRIADRVALDAELARWLHDEPSAVVERRLQAAGVAAGMVLHPRLQVEHPLFVGRGYPCEIDQPGNGPLLLEGAAFTGTRMGRPRCTPAPGLGQHTEQVCRQVLGLGAEELAELVRTGAVDPIEA
jgi:crotonobetainyl-CoA:carnitine CoA-transferase CaiB-like acyl-CoA transferase